MQATTENQLGECSLQTHHSYSTDNIIKIMQLAKVAETWTSEGSSTIGFRKNERKKRMDTKLLF